MNGIAVIANGLARSHVRGTALEIGKPHLERTPPLREEADFDPEGRPCACRVRRSGLMPVINPGGGVHRKTTALCEEAARDERARCAVRHFLRAANLLAAARKARSWRASMKGFAVPTARGVEGTTDVQCTAAANRQGGRWILGLTCASRSAASAWSARAARASSAPIRCSSRCTGPDIAAARTVVVKSRGHFRGGFDEYFPPERVIEVDTPRLTSPVLERLTFEGPAAPGLSARPRRGMDAARGRL